MSAAPAAASGQEGEGIRVTTRAAQISVGGQLQVQFSTTDAPVAIPFQWELRRVRLDFRAEIVEGLRARVQPELAGGEVALRDAWVEFEFDPAARLVVGQAYRPFSLLAQTGTTRILPIERGARIRGLPSAPLEHANLLGGLAYADRDIGIQLRGAPEGAPLGLEYGVGFFNGPLFGLAGGNATYQLAGRVSAAPAAGVRVGVGASRRDFGRAEPDGGGLTIRRGTAWQADLEIGSFDSRFHLMGEVAAGVQNPFSETRREFTAAQLWTAVRTEPIGRREVRLEPIARVSVGHPDASPTERAQGLGGGVLLTPGLNVYLGARNRLMVNVDLWEPRGGATSATSFKTMFQVAF